MLRHDPHEGAAVATLIAAARAPFDGRARPSSVQRTGPGYLPQITSVSAGVARTLERAVSGPLNDGRPVKFTRSRCIVTAKPGDAIIPVLDAKAVALVSRARFGREIPPQPPAGGRSPGRVPQSQVPHPRGADEHPFEVRLSYFESP